MGAAEPRRPDRPRSKWTDERVEGILGTLLQSGVIVSGLVVLAGGILFMLRYGHDIVRYADFVAERESLQSIRDIGRNALHGDARDIVECGLLLLIATPVARVVFSIIGFALARERLYVVLTLIVLLILLYSLFGGAT
jgi:uncharacterized membrane protein